MPRHNTRKPGVPHGQAEEHTPSSTTIEVWVEKLEASLGEDFGWQRVPQGVSVTPTRLTPMRTLTARQRERGRQLFAERRFDLAVSEGLVDAVLTIAPTWEGDVVLPAFEASKRYRLVIVEFEEYLTDDSRPYDPVPTKKDRRVVFVEHITLS